MSFTLAEIKSAIDQYEVDREENEDTPFAETLIEGDWSLPRDQRKQEVELPGIGTAVYVDAKSGAEGGGEDIWVVFKIGERFFRLNGYYASYDGSNWGESGLDEVTPKEKVVTVFETVDSYRGW